MLQNQSIILLATAIHIKGDTLGDTDLDFKPGVDLGMFVGLFAVATYDDGDLTDCVAKIKNAAGNNSNLGLINLTQCTLGNDVSNLLSGTWQTSGNITAEVVAASGVTSHFSIYVYGIPRMQTL